MVQLDLKVPTLVSHVMVNNKPHFNLRPLFLPNPQITDRRYQSAKDVYKKEIRQYFKYYELNKAESPQLLWFLFNPETHIERRPAEFKMGKILIKGAFLLVRFIVNDLKIVCLPQLNNMMYIEGSAKTPNGFNEIKFEKALKKHLKKEKERLGDDFNHQHYYSNNKDFLTTVPLRLEIKGAAISYAEKADNNFFASLFENPEFQGILEVQKVGTELNDLFPNDLHRAFFRDSIIEKLYQAIYFAKNTPLAIVGPEGVGRHTVIHEVIHQYLSKYQTDDYQQPGIWHIDPTRIIAGMSIVGHWQQRFEAIIDYLKKPYPQKEFSHKMLIDNPVALLRIGKSAQNDMTLSDVLKPYLEKRELQLILIATPEEWTIFQEQDRSFSSLFQLLRLEEPTEETAIKMILEQRKQLEKKHEVRISIAAINQLLYLQRNYFKNKALPGSIIKLLQQLSIKYKEDAIEADQVRESFQSISGLQERIFDTAYTYEKGEIRQELSRQLIGQTDAVEVLADVIHLFKSKLNTKSKPISSMLFIGPTGVGKTQAAKVLAKYLLGNEDALLRFDMNEYIDGSAPQRLIGDHYNPEGQLTGKVRYQPFGIILFDELEKAHPLVLDLLLQVLDDGRLTDSLGRTVDFTNTIIIMTSNLGAAAVNSTISINKTQELEDQVYRKAVENNFRPEFVNRIEQMVIFKNLELDHIMGIARLQINDLLKRDGFVRRTTILNISNDALSWVAKRGFNQKMGGRALRRQIEQDLTSLSANQLLKIRTTNPIILDINLEGDHLKPYIRPLEFVANHTEPLFPQLQFIEKGGTFYRWLLDNVEELVQIIHNWEEKQSPEAFEKGWIYYDFKTKIDVVKEQIRTIMIAYEDPNYMAANALRIKQLNVKYRSYERGAFSKEDIKDRLFREAALKEINDVYRYSTPEFDNKYSEFVGHYIDVALLHLYSLGVRKGKIEQVRLRFKSLISNLGQKEIQFLLERYRSLFKHLELPFLLDEENHELILEGYSILPLIRGEEGVHLFYMAQRNPLPIMVEITAEHYQTKDNYQVIRIYDEHKTLTDLRTSYTNAYNISDEEFKLLLFGGLDPELRNQLLETSFV
ncbi:MAG: hypothetical protein Sapg2KO_04610 [Saprospiraceae bacterium]